MSASPHANGRMPMGYASYFEDNTDKVYDNKYMRGDYDPRPERKPVSLVASPPLQPVLANVVIPPPVRPDAETVARRERAMHEKHVLALYEMMPGHRWRR
jgi:hypothetical protein